MGKFFFGISETVIFFGIFCNVFANGHFVGNNVAENYKSIYENTYTIIFVSRFIHKLFRMFTSLEFCEFTLLRFLLLSYRRRNLHIICIFGEFTLFNSHVAFSPNSSFLIFHLVKPFSVFIYSLDFSGVNLKMRFKRIVSTSTISSIWHFENLKFRHHLYR